MFYYDYHSHKCWAISSTFQLFIQSTCSGHRIHLQKRLKQFYAEEEQEAASAGKKSEKAEKVKKNDNKAKNVQKRNNAKK